MGSGDLPAGDTSVQTAVPIRPVDGGVGAERRSGGAGFLPNLETATMDQSVSYALVHARRSAWGNFHSPGPFTSRKSAERPARGPPAWSSTGPEFHCRQTAKHVAGIFLIMCVPWVISNDTKAIYRFDIPQRYSTFSPSIFSHNRTNIYFNNHMILSEYHSAMDILAAQKPEKIGFYGPRRLTQYPI